MNCFDWDRVWFRDLFFFSFFENEGIREKELRDVECVLMSWFEYLDVVMVLVRIFLFLYEVINCF